MYVPSSFGSEQHVCKFLLNGCILCLNNHRWFPCLFPCVLKTRRCHLHNCASSFITSALYTIIHYLREKQENNRQTATFIPISALLVSAKAMIFQPKCHPFGRDVYYYYYYYDISCTAIVWNSLLELKCLLFGCGFSTFCSGNRLQCMIHIIIISIHIIMLLFCNDSTLNRLQCNLSVVNMYPAVL